MENKKEIVRNISIFVQNGLSTLHSLDEKQLSDIIQYANDRYYNETPIMTDNQYDIIREYIISRYPNNKAVASIGAEIERNKVILPYEMASMDKIKPDTNALKNWLTKYNGPYLISTKLDGISALYTTEDKHAKLFTRGNGKVGQDISHLIPFLKLPKVKGITLRGELIISKNIFENKYKTYFANARNMVAGIVNNKHISDAIKDVDFVAYEVINPEIPPSIQMDFLTNIKINRILYSLTDNLSNELLSNILVEWRKTYKYEIDGIIVTDDNIYERKTGNPEHAFAFKMVLSDQIAEAKVVDVIWTPSKDGYLKPRVQIEPIKLGGVTIEFATGFNAAFIKDNKIGIGATIELIRSGDVIPYIQKVIVSSLEGKMPNIPYIWNNTNIDIMIENAYEDPTVIEKNITGFFKGIGVDGLSSGNISRLIDGGYNTVWDILNMNEQDFLKIDGFKDKMANKIYSGIKEKIKESSIISIMSASNIFGRGFSEKKIELIMNEIPDIIISEDSIDAKIVKISQIKGMANKSAEAFVNKIEDFKDFLAKCGLENKLYTHISKENMESKQIDIKTHPLHGKKVVLTGTRDKIILEFLKNIGANSGTSISKNTFLVVSKNINEQTGKLKEAINLNIPIISVDEFIKSYIE